MKTWLFTIARNECIRYSKKNFNHISFDELSTLSGNICIEDTYCNKEMTEYILNYIVSFSEPTRSLIILRLQDKTFVEIGKIINRSDVWCRVTFMRFKNNLIKKFEKHFDK